MRRVFLSTLATLWATCFAGIGSSEESEQPVVIGALYNQTGSQAGMDVPSSQGAQLAVSQVNQAGGLLGRKVRLVIEDCQSDATVVRRKAADILRRAPTTPALIGLSDTDLVRAAAPIAARQGCLFLTSGATSPHLPTQVPKYLYLACFGDNVQASAAAEWSYQNLSARTAVVLYDASESYTRLLQQYFQARFKQLGGRVVSERILVTDKLGKSIDNLPEADIVFLAAESPDDIVKTIRLLRAAGITSPVVGGDSFDSDGLWKDHPDIGDVFYTTHAFVSDASTDPRVAAFRDAFRQAYPESTPNAFAALGYDATRLVIAAIRRAGSSDRDDVLRALAETRDFTGVTGTISYATGSRIPHKSVTLIRVQKGQRKLVRNVVPQRVPAP